MMAPDINVLVASWREDHSHHSAGKGWLEGALLNHQANGGIQILPMVAAGFLRLVTNVKVFVRPASPEQATEFLDLLLALPGVQMPEIGRAEWEACQQLCREKNITGPDVSDAFLAGAVIEFGSHFVTFDRDFLKLLPAARLTVLRN